jgi:hypothetical protein
MMRQLLHILALARNSKEMTMDNVTFIEITDAMTGDVAEHAIIDRGNGEFTSMPKAVYDAQVEHLTEIPTPDEA